MLFLFVGCLSKATILPPPLMDTKAINEQVDWAQAGDEATQILSGYLQVDTINPEGNEHRGAEFLATILEREGIAYEIHDSAPNRGNLIAKLPGNGSNKPLCLLSHIDVVTAEPEKWVEDPLSGVIKDGYIWGRGALDMKGMGVMELMTLVWLKRLNIPLNRDVILLAVADEEIDGSGVQYLRDTYWDFLDCEYVINEGGLGLHDMMFEGQTVYPISVGEKGNVWLKMIAQGEPGHGSTPRPNEAPKYLLEALEILENRDLNPQFHPSLEQFVVNIGGHKGGLEGWVLRQPFMRSTVVKSKMMDNPITRASLINTVHLTGLGGENEPNVVPSEVYAILDCRIQPGVDPEKFIAELQEMVGDNIHFEVLAARPGNVSEMDDPMYYALMRNAVLNEANSVAGPVISVGFTDSNYLRPLGVKAYGFVPIALTAEDMTGFHGHNEKISEDNLEMGLHKLFLSVVEVAAVPNP